MEKLKTIGDAYLAAAGLVHQTANPTLDAVRCGPAMISVAERLPTTWQLRVGIHTGPLIAGIVGRQKYQYDIWGDTLNNAARMESQAQSGTLFVNADTWRIIESHCNGESLGLRDIKGKGQQEVFPVDSVKTI
ncbi:MAG: adenylate cyclase [Verrucomicrobiales bacterium]|jgi:adenylate cyclase